VSLHLQFIGAGGAHSAYVRSEPTVIGANPLPIGGDVATEAVPDGYTGACAVVPASDSDNVIAVLPSLNEARRVARYAKTPDGGYGSVVIEATRQPVTHETLEDWLLAPFRRHPK